MSNQYGPEEISGLLRTNRIERYCDSAICALVLFDHLSTITREVDMVWNRKLCSATLLFYLNRWTLSTWVILNVVTDFLPSSLTSCIALHDLDTIVALILLANWAAFSALRMFAMSNGSWALAVAVCALGMVPVATNVYNFFGTTSYQLVDIPAIGIQCSASKRISQATNAKFEIGTRVCVIASDAIVLGATWLRTYKLKREAIQLRLSVPLTTLLLRDGTIYFTVLLCLNILNIAGQTTNAFIYAAEFFVPLSSIIITRFILNLRQIAHNGHLAADDSVVSDVMRMSSARFGSFVGNMGEPLQHDTRSDSDMSDWEDACPEDPQTLALKDVRSILDGIYVSAHDVGTLITVDAI